MVIISNSFPAFTRPLVWMLNTFHGSLSINLSIGLRFDVVVLQERSLILPVAVETFHYGQTFITFPTKQRSKGSTYSSFLHTLSHHHHVVDAVLPRHPPEVVFSAGQRALGGDVLPAVVVTLRTDERGISTVRFRVSELSTCINV